MPESVGAALGPVAPEGTAPEGRWVPGTGPSLLGPAGRWSWPGRPSTAGVSWGTPLGASADRPDVQAGPEASGRPRQTVETAGPIRGLGESPIPVWERSRFKAGESESSPVLLSCASVS
ncbi:hypothetical protein GCM10027294_02360 [Marinactinospora endophytica]